MSKGNKRTHLCILWTLEKGSFIRTVEDGAVGDEGRAKCKGVKALTGQLCWFLTGGSPLHTTSPLPGPEVLPTSILSVTVVWG